MTELETYMAYVSGAVLGQTGIAVTDWDKVIITASHKNGAPPQSCVQSVVADRVIRKNDLVTMPIGMESSDYIVQPGAKPDGR